MIFDWKNRKLWTHEHVWSIFFVLCLQFQLEEVFLYHFGRSLHGWLQDNFGILLCMIKIL